jgi:hypothetical protein
MNPSTGARDSGSVDTRQVANSAAVIHPLLTWFCRCSRVTSNAGQLDPAIKHKRKEERLPLSSTTTFFVFQRTVSLFFFLFLAVEKEAEKQRDIVRDDVGCTGVTRLAL